MKFFAMIENLTKFQNYIWDDHGCIMLKLKISEFKKVMMFKKNFVIFLAIIKSPHKSQESTKKRKTWDSWIGKDNITHKSFELWDFKIITLT